jgi:metal-sulfur cluster biosynthetic enzyme
VTAAAIHAADRDTAAAGAAATAAQVWAWLGEVADPEIR